MGDRDSCADPWLQKPATRASPNSFNRFNEILRLLRTRDNIRPRPLKTVFQVFRDDSNVQSEVVNETNTLMKD